MLSSRLYDNHHSALQEEPAAATAANESGFSKHDIFRRMEEDRERVSFLVWKNDDAAEGRREGIIEKKMPHIHMVIAQTIPRRNMDSISGRACGCRV